MKQEQEQKEGQKKNIIPRKPGESEQDYQARVAEEMRKQGGQGKEQQQSQPT